MPVEDLDYTSPAWRRARADALSRDGSVCQAVEVFGLLSRPCGATTQLHVHHIVRPEDGGEPYALNNLTVLCDFHHHRLHGLLPLPATDRRRRQRANAAAYRPRTAA